MAALPVSQTLYCKGRFTYSVEISEAVDIILVIRTELKQVSNILAGRIGPTYKGSVRLSYNTV